MKYVLFYEAAADVMQKAPLHFAAHQQTFMSFRGKGLEWIGPFANPSDGAMAIFSTREAAEAFVKVDPFVLHGVVKSHRIAEWREFFSTLPG